MCGERSSWDVTTSRDGHSIIDAMRADRTNAVNEQFNIGLDDPAPTGTSFREVALATWRANLTTAFGDGSGVTGAVLCNGTQCTITVRWDDSRAGGAEEDADVHTVVTEVQL